VNSNLKPQTPNLSKRVLVLVGPTASGKTPVSLLIAKQLNAEILSADSRQLYKLLDIGTAKVSREEREAVKHYFVDELMPDEKFHAAEFGKRGREIIDDIFQRDKVPFVVGGSGLYIQALIDGFFEGPPADDVLREELESRIKEEGSNSLLEELRTFDPDAAEKMLPSHTRRIIRAHEVYRLTGIPISKMQETRIEINFTPVFVGLRWDRAKLYQGINRRVDRMLEAGLVDEVKRLRASGYSPRDNALNTVGYKEVFQYLDGDITYERAVELIKQNSRRYAKRQLTWFRADERIRWFDADGVEDFEDVAGLICRHFMQLSIPKTVDRVA
jgi:tRNA dimethylallyltransferase